MYLGLPFHRVEIDIVLQNSVEIVVRVLDGGECLVEHIADVGFQILEGGHLIAVFVRPRLTPSGAEQGRNVSPYDNLLSRSSAKSAGSEMWANSVFPEGIPFQVEFIRKSA